MLAHTVYSAFRSVVASGWPKADGEVTYAGIQEEDDGDGSTFLPVIEFKYKVRGKEYVSSNFAFGFGASGFRFLARSIFNRYKTRPFVKVAYNPRKPSEGVLLTGICFFHLFNAGLLGGILYLFGQKVVH